MKKMLVAVTVALAACAAIGGSAVAVSNQNSATPQQVDTAMNAGATHEIDWPQPDR
ncbi:hypothetical protein [Streptomyces sp. NPDC019224]|uniref:hypothetical protein n=1 Tax=Streptomyces sp. NPDC019224 TaxID=3154484 RepID=UPI0033D9631E